jgi:asparagine synthetase B (glutamine-hydrolysing)
MPISGLTVQQSGPVSERRFGPPDYCATAMDGSAEAQTTRAVSSMKGIVRDIVRHDKTRSLGICLSGGLDSCLLLSIAAELRDLGEVEHVTAFHYTWPAVLELINERTCASAMAAYARVEFVELDQSEVQLETLIESYSDLVYPHAQGYYLQLQSAVEAARIRGVETILTGVGSEVHFAEPSPDTISRAPRDNYPEFHWPATEEFSEWNIPPWTTAEARDVQRKNWNAMIIAPSREMARRRIAEFAIAELSTSVAQEHFLISRACGDVKVWYPYLDARLVDDWHATTRYMRVMRLGGELYGKALLRFALRDRSPIQIWLRSCGSPYEAIEQKYLRESWSQVRAFWSRECILHEMNLVNVDEIRNLMASCRDFLMQSTFILPTILVEAWLRRNVAKVHQWSQE